MKKKVKKAIKLYDLIYDEFVKSVYVRTAKRAIMDPKRKAIWSGVHLNREQEEAIDSFFEKNYGRRVPYWWHRYFMAYTGKFDVRYMPESLSIPEIVPLFNPKAYYKATSDKNLMMRLFRSGLNWRIPETYLSCTAGLFIGRHNEVLDVTQVYKVLGNSSDCFIKPTVETGSGIGCRVLRMNKGIDEFTGETAQTIIQNYGKNFIVQERIICHDAIRKISPDSVNTFRIISYIWNGKICLAPIVLRIGRKGKFVDNAHAGGMFVGVRNDGTLLKQAFTEFRDVFSEHPDSHTVFEGYYIPNFDEVKKAAAEAHAYMPQNGIIHWDFTIDKDGNVVFIEGNMRYGGFWIIQMAHGEGVFGENTEEILNFARDKRRSLL